MACREWRGKPSSTKSWSAFKQHFRLAEGEYNRTATTHSAGYHAANAAMDNLHIGDPTPTDNAPFVTTPHAFAAAVAEATAASTPTPLPPAPPITSTFDPASFAAAVVAAVAAANPRHSGNRGRTGNGNRNNRHTNVPAGYGYCWSHGYVPQRGNTPHSSATCKNKHEGHRDDATAQNKLGGATTVWQSRSY